MATLVEVLGGGEEWIEVAAVGGGGWADRLALGPAASGVDVGAWVGPGDDGT